MKRGQRTYANADSEQIYLADYLDEDIYEPRQNSVYRFQDMENLPDEDSKGNWHPGKDGDGNNILVAGKGDNIDTLKNYLIGIYGSEENISQDEWLDLSAQVRFLSDNVENDIIEGHAIGSESGIFDNLVGKFLINQYVNDPSWAVTTFEGNNCSPTTFNRTDKAMEFVYGKDYLGKLSYGGNDLYRRWQGIKKDKGAVYGTGIVPELGLGDQISQEQIYNGELNPGALIRLVQTPGPGNTGVSWHAAIFIDYIRNEEGNIIGMWYWHHWTYNQGNLKGKYTSYSLWNFDNKGKYVPNGYKPTLGANFK